MLYTHQVLVMYPHQLPEGRTEAGEGWSLSLCSPGWSSLLY